jgi:hypothetical protein
MTADDPVTPHALSTSRGDLAGFTDEGDRSVPPHTTWASVKRVPRHVVLTIIGSSSDGNWQHIVKHELAEEDAIEVIPVPISTPWIYTVPFRGLDTYALWRLHRSLGDVFKTLTEHDRVSIVAHSYGTFLIVKWLTRRYTGRPLANLFLLGSIVPDHKLKRVRNFVDHIENHVFGDDIVVLWAEAIRPFRYGAAGRYGVSDAVLNPQPFRSGLNRYFAGKGHEVDPAHVVATLREVARPRRTRSVPERVVLPDFGSIGWRRIIAWVGGGVVASLIGALAYALYWTWFVV